MKRMTRKCLSFWLVVALVIGLMPVTSMTAKADTTITDITLNIQIPIAGQNPSDEENVFCNLNVCEVTSLKWREGSFSNVEQATEETPLSSTDTFKDNETYTAVIQLEPTTSETVFSLTNATVTVNGKEAMIDDYSHSTWLVVMISFKTGSIGDNISYSLNDGTGVLTLSGTGVTYSFDSTYNVSPFNGNDKIKSVVIGEGITEITNSVFLDCPNINSVSVPASLNKIDVDELCVGSGGWNVAEENQYYSEGPSGCLYNKSGTTLIHYADSSATEYEDFTIPDNIKKISNHAFNSKVTLNTLTLAGDSLELLDYSIDGSHIKHIVIQEGVKRFGNRSSIVGLLDTEITIPSTMTYIDSYSFLGGNTSIQKIHVSEDNSTYMEKDGALITRSGTLIIYPAGKKDTTYLIPSEVKTINVRAFRNNDYLEEIIFLGAVTEIDSHAMDSLNNLKSIAVLNDKCEMGTGMSLFVNCPNSIIIKGRANSTAEEYASVKKVEFSIYECSSHIAGDEYQLVKEPNCKEEGVCKKICIICGELTDETFNIPEDPDTHSINSTPVAVKPATDESDGVKAHYACDLCDKCFADEKGKTELTAEDLCIPKVTTVKFTQSEYDYTVDFAEYGPEIFVSDANGTELNEYSDYKVKWVSTGLFGVCKVIVTGKGNYSFEKEISCTIHPSSTLRWPDDISKLNHGSYTLNLYGNTKNFMIDGDDRVLCYGTLGALVMYEGAVSYKMDSMDNMLIDLDKDGSDDIYIILNETSLFENGSPIIVKVLDTCSIMEEVEYTLSESTQAKLQSEVSVPYYDKLVIRFADPCAKGHSYGSDWKSDATGHWHECTECGKRDTVHTHVAGAPATLTTPQKCKVCGYVMAPVKKAASVGTKIKDSRSKATYKVTSASAGNYTVEYIKPNSKTAKSLVVPSTIKVDGITYKVTSIAKNAFKNNKKLTKITIGKNVVSIGAKAFYGCKKLKSITIKTTKLTSKKVGKQAFKKIHAKATIKVPKSKLKAYKKMLKAKGVGAKAKIKK